MAFNSYVFILLMFPLGAIGWHLIRRKNERLAMLFIIGISLFFCGFYNYIYAVALAISTVANYLLGRIQIAIDHDNTKARKLVLTASVILNIAALVYFKYSSFFVESINVIFKSDFNITQAILPLGISFYTFSQISYQIDLYREDFSKHNFIEYAFFITYFPKLSMGPIVRFESFRQSISRSAVNWDQIGYGIYTFAIGLAKKVLIADTFALAVNYGYGNIYGLNSTEAVLVVIFYTIQIYFDFSGYSDMALGISKVLNIELPTNFNMPYSAVSIVDFWDRWHITLSAFFTKYLYIPLGGNRKGKFRTYLNVMIVFLVSGLWHGASWTFVLWGAVHGIFVVLTKAFKKISDRTPKFIGWSVTFVFVCLSWVLFRAESLADISHMLGRIFSFSGFGVSENILNCFELPEILKIESLLRITSISFYKYFAMAGIIAVAFFAMFFTKEGIETKERFVKFKPTIAKMIFASVLLVWSIVSFSGIITYIYQGF